MWSTVCEVRASPSAEPPADGSLILARLREIDELTLRFNPLGFGGRLTPEDSAAFQSACLERAALDERVPEDIRTNFTRVRNLYMFGLLDYEMFSISQAHAYFVLEGALRRRFVTYYAGRIPVLRNRVAETLEVRVLEEARRAAGRAAREGVDLRLNDGFADTIPRNYRALVRWARRRELLPGQRNMVVLDALGALRNYSAHPDGSTTDMPPQAARTLNDVAEIINKLWGTDTPDGRLYPTPMRRITRVAALAPGGGGAVTFGSPMGVHASDAPRDDWTYAVFLASEDDELATLNHRQPGTQRFSYTPGFETTRYPCELIWGPGPRSELLPVLSDYEAAEDTVTHLDRLFMIRRSADGLEMPRSLADTASTTMIDEATWYVVRADDPFDAFHHVREHGPSYRKPERETRVGCGAMFSARLAGDRAARSFAAKLMQQAQDTPRTPRIPEPIPAPVTNAQG